MKKKGKKIKLELILLLISCIMLAPYTFASTNDIDIVDVPKSKNTKIRITNNILTDKILLSSTKFDLRDYIQIPIKNQKSTQDCWAFATNTVLETNLALKNKQIYDFSERHLVYSTSKTFTDGINILAHNKEVNGGGNEIIAMAYFTSGRGPVLETEMPFVENERQISLSEISNKTVQKKVTDYIIFEQIVKHKDSEGNITYTDSKKTKTYTQAEVESVRNSIKSHIMNYGAVASMTVSGSAYNNYYNYDMDYPAFYCNNPNYVPNHQITIIGWDDNYGIENFNTANQPSSPGAYLVLNSYGTENFEYGCYYISYEDCFIECGALGIINAENIDYDNIYQYDPLGQSTNICLDDEQVLYGANVFTKDKTTVETLAEISIASAMNQNIEVYVNPNNGTLSAQTLQKVETKQKEIRSGYTTIEFETPIKLTGEQFAVAIKYIGQNQKAYIGIECPNTEFWMTATANENESFCSADGDSWEDLNLIDETIKNANICIKAFTNIIDYNIISDSYEIKEDFVLSILPETTVGIFKNNITVGTEFKIYENDVELEENQIIATGNMIKLSNNKIYKAVVRGDITGTGNITSTDISKLKLHLIEDTVLEGAQAKAADINCTGDITLTDLSQMKETFIGL